MLRYLLEAPLCNKKKTKKNNNNNNNNIYVCCTYSSSAYNIGFLVVYSEKNKNNKKYMPTTYVFAEKRKTNE